ncbi:hypothetical protein D3C86_1494300 [compost metagenome]
MIGKGHILAQRLVEYRVTIGRRVVVGERALASGLLVVGRVGADILHREDALLGLVQRARVDVRGVNDRAVQQSLFTQEDGHRIDLFPGAAPGDPDLDRRVSLEQRHHFLTNGQEVRGVAKHLADRNRQQLQELHERRRVMQDFFLQCRNGAAFELRQRMAHPALDRCTGVITKIVAVLEVDSLDQQAQFDFAASLPRIIAFH